MRKAPSTGFRFLGPGFHYPPGVSGVLLSKEEFICPSLLLNCPAGGRSTYPAGLNFFNPTEKPDLSPSLGPAHLPPSGLLRRAENRG